MFMASVEPMPVTSETMASGGLGAWWRIASSIASDAVMIIRSATNGMR